MSLMPLFKGFVIGAGMIIPIGAQNAYVLNQGIKKNFHFVAATICITCDLLLMSLGIFGGGALISSHSFIYTMITWGGIIFLTGYGALFFQSFLTKTTENNQNTKPLNTRKAVIITTLAVTLLNPHVYLDTLMIIGSISSQFAADEKILFLFGTVLASFAWFYSLAFSAAKFSNWLKKEQVQQGINLSVALIMWAIAWSLYLSFKTP
jgi:L-lysine exporter family protein LysE/ArgO